MLSYIMRFRTVPPSDENKLRIFTAVFPIKIEKPKLRKLFYYVKLLNYFEIKR